MDAALAPVARRGLVLVGCGRMGGALLEGWLAAGIPPAAIRVIEPAAHAVAGFAARGVAVDGPTPVDPAAVVLAVKPQSMAAALPTVAPLVASETLALSIAAGTPIAALEAALPSGAAVARAMPNTPAAVGRGVTALVANASGAALLPLAEALLAAVGETLRLTDEAQMDAVTALSGSGPAYVFHLIEAMAAAGEAEGLPADLAMRLARATVCGAAELAYRSAEDAAALRAAVTSPGGTTAAGLTALMDPAEGLAPLMRRTVARAAARSRELRG